MISNKNTNAIARSLKNARSRRVDPTMEVVYRGDWRWYGMRSSSHWIVLQCGEHYLLGYNLYEQEELYPGGRIPHTDQDFVFRVRFLHKEDAEKVLKVLAHLS